MTLGVWALATDDDGGVHVVLAIPLSIVLLFIGYSGPVIAGLLVLAFLRRWYPVSLGVYLIAYYALLVPAVRTPLQHLGRN